MLNARMFCQQLSRPRFDRPADVVAWMGAIQGQDSRSVKWAVGLRMREPSMSQVIQAMDTGEVLRLHILRTTWHLVPGRDMKWMADLNGPRLIRSIHSWAKAGGLSPSDYMPLYPAIVDTLTGQSLTKQEIAEELGRQGLKNDQRVIELCLGIGEAEGRICSGPENEGKDTYTLYEERITDPVLLSREEALGELARRYFRSHSPATLEDFVWWSGLGVSDAKNAISSLGGELTTVKTGGRDFIWHTGETAQIPDTGKILHFLPPYDEYLISYKDRSDSLRPDHARFAHNNFGIFQPVILHNGRITGNWRKTGRKTGDPYQCTFFPLCRPAAKPLIDKAWKRYCDFLAH